MTQSKSTKPVHEIRYGNVRAAIWRNEKGYHNVTFERSYKANEQWSQSSSFGRDDLPRLQACADEAYCWIFKNSGSADQSDSSASDIPPGDYR